jgi:glycosyltransferase involved in cell wall biosynthesis
MSETVLTETEPSIAVLIPCFNEAAAIAGVVEDFRKVLPQAKIWVFDNNSSDDTVNIARAAGAEVRHESRQGKGNVIRRMFADVDADIYLMADGDATYDAASAPRMIQLLREQNLDMVVARRKTEESEAYRAGHQLGNRLLTGTVGRIFGNVMQDILSGYRVFSRRFVKSYPAFSTGFQTETELTIHALELRLPVAEVDTPYYARPEGSDSKLSTWKDGSRILATIFRLFALEQPFRFFSIIALACLMLATAFFIPLLLEFFETGLVLKIPTLIFVVSAYVLSVVSLSFGIILHAITTARLEARRLAYLAVKPNL